MRISIRSRAGKSVIDAMMIVACGMFAASASAADPLWGAKMLSLNGSELGAIAKGAESHIEADGILHVRCLRGVEFGSVAKGADTLVRVVVKNVFNEEIQITNLKSGCSCVSWDEVKNSAVPAAIVIPSGQQRVLTLKMDTVRFDGERKAKATIFLMDTVHRQTTAVEFSVTAFIRPDIVMTPGSVNFGTVAVGSGAERKVDIHYAGRNNWKITQTKVTNPNLAAFVKELPRLNDGQVKYELLVTLKPDAPVGTVRDQLVMLTDDANNPQISVVVEAIIEADVTITDLQFGTLAPGQSKAVNLVIRAGKPFKIEELYREKKANAKLQDDAFRVKLNTKVSSLLSLPVTFTAPDVTGAFEETFYVKIADRPQPIPFKARVRIQEPSGPASPARQ